MALGRLCFAVLLLNIPGLAAAKEPSVEHAQTLLSQGKEQAAVSELEAVLRRDPDNLFALGNIGMISARTGHLQRGEQTLSRAFRLKPNRTTGSWASLFWK